MSQLSLHQRIVNAAASQEVENVKARHTYYHGRADATGEWANIWAMNDDSSWAHAFGRMRGKDQIWYGSVTQYDQMAMENWLEMFKKYPEIGGKDPRPLMEASVHTLVTDVIEVAADGKSARGSFITPGVIPPHPRGGEVLQRAVGALRLRLRVRGRGVEVPPRARVSRHPRQAGRGQLGP